MADASLIKTHYIDGKDQFLAQAEHFIDCCLNGTKCISPAEDGVVIMKILEALYKSAETGKSVDII